MSNYNFEEDALRDMPEPLRKIEDVLKEHCKDFLIIFTHNDTIYYQASSTISASGFIQYVDNIIMNTWNHEEHDESDGI